MRWQTRIWTLSNGGYMAASFASEAFRIDLLGLFVGGLRRKEHFRAGSRELELERNLGAPR